jgi:hypothetical protein
MAENYMTWNGQVCQAHPDQICDLCKYTHSYQKDVVIHNVTMQVLTSSRDLTPISPSRVFWPRSRVRNLSTTTLPS